MPTGAERLMALFQTDAKHRDEFWLDRLNAAFWPARLGSFTPHVVEYEKTGLFSYRLGGNDLDGGEHPGEPASLVDYAISEGIGFVLWPSNEPQPIWSFSLGSVLSYRLYGIAFAPRFWDAPPDVPGKEEIQEAEMIKTGPPNEQMFPLIVRRVVYRYMHEKLGIAEPKMTLVQRPNMVSRLVFDLPEEHFGSEEATVKAFNNLAWHIPSCIPLYHMPNVGKRVEMTVV